MPMKSYFQLLDHTADVGLEIFARSREEIFTLAAQGMLTIITHPEDIHPLEKKGITLKSDRLDDLLVVWLNRLNFEFEVEGLLFSEFELGIEDAFTLKAVVRGEHFDPERHEILREIKAATYHQLVVEKRQSMWYARVIFDV